MPNAHRPDAMTSQPVEIVIVTAPRCHLCDNAGKLLKELGGQYRLATREVGLESDEGAAIVRRFRVAFPPVVLIDGAYLGYGRISRGKLVKALNQAVGQDRRSSEAHTQGGG